MNRIQSSILTISWALKLTWATNSRLTFGVVICAVLRNLLPAVLVLIFKGLVNSISEALSSGELVIGSILPILVLGLAVSVVEVLSRNFSIYYNERLRDEIDLNVSQRILEHGAKLDLAFFEDPRFQDVMARARQNTASTPIPAPKSMATTKSQPGSTTA